jgi:ferrous iron transport protein B
MSAIVHSPSPIRPESESTRASGSPDHDAAGGAALPRAGRALRFALLGNPNTGKTTLFNQLCGLRARTANFPGSTIEARRGHLEHDGWRFEIVDLPGVYSLRLDLPEARVCREYLQRGMSGDASAHALLIVADATNLHRNLIFVAEALQQGVPAVVALTMIDLAQRGGLSLDAQRLGELLGCPVVPVCARSGDGVRELREAMTRPRASTAPLPDPAHAAGAARWAEELVERSLGGAHAVGRAADTLTDRLDAAFTHPVLGLGVFLLVMTGLFYTIFTLAAVPMDLIELMLASFGEALGTLVPPGAIHDMMVNGIVGGIAGTLVFLPQICLLFFLISLLEDTGYLARAAFVMDRLLRRFGLPGQAFVPLLSAHACAIPAIMSARLIPDRRDRIATVLVAPFMSCSARLPVYVLLISVLLDGRPLLAGAAFTGCYALGAIAALLTALLFRRTILRGPSRPMILELPSYKRPSLRTALLTTADRAVVFLRKAGTVIVAICIVLWWLRSYPHVEPPAEVSQLRERAAAVQDADDAAAAALLAEAGALESSAMLAHSFAGRLGRAIEPAFAPLGFDWQLSIGVVTSFAAREVFVSTMAVLFTGDEEAEDAAVLDRIRTARRADGSALLSPATAASLLVFYVLAMQCLPTLPVTRRETGSWGWAAIQFGWMSGMAWLAAFVTYHVLRALGVS